MFPIRLPAWTRNGFATLLVGGALLVWPVACSSSNDGGSGGSGAANDAYASERQACVDRINGFRATLGLPALARWKDQEGCTDTEAASDSQTGQAHGKFGSCKEGAQNECPGWGSVEQTVQGCLQSMWDEGPGEPYSEHGHYINMSNPDYKQVACGFHETPDGKVWAIQNFH
jgi:Cysteine-rich secretory protein family